jgi:hypothetical protein
MRFPVVWALIGSIIFLVLLSALRGSRRLPK